MPPYRSSPQNPQRREFSALRLPCDVPGCHRWFKNQSGLTQHKRSHPCLSHSRGSPDFLEQDHGSNVTPPIAEHVAGDGPQDEGPQDFNYGATSDQELDGVTAEFVGPDNKTYRNYHAGLNGKPMHTLFYLYSFFFFFLQHEDVTPWAIFYQNMLRRRLVFQNRQMIGPHSATGWNSNLPSFFLNAWKCRQTKSTCYLKSGPHRYSS